jgi:hypothetical protein
LSKKITYGESNEIKKDRANEEFKRLLCKQLPKDDKIWSDGDKFDIEKFVKEPYLSIVNEIASNAKTFYLISAICIAFLTFFHHYLGHWRFIRLIFLTSWVDRNSLKKVQNNRSDRIFLHYLFEHYLNIRFPR